jgi:Tfp pilus assembly protein PilV
MINENENIQPELNMVPEESTAPVAEPQAEPATEPAVEPTTETQAQPEQSVETTSTTETTAPKAEENVGTYPSSVQPENDVQQTLQQTQQRLQQVEQQNLQNQMLYETENYKQQLAQQGYSNEQIQYAADTYYQNRVQQVQVEQNYQKGLEFREGQFKASLQFGKKYNVDPEVLLKYKNPQEMETAAKHMSEVRALKEENVRLKQGKVPTQNFDSNSAPANASSSEERLLDQYNQGVRNPETEAAARRAAGIG